MVVIETCSFWSFYSFSFYDWFILASWSFMREDSSCFLASILFRDSFN